MDDVVEIPEELGKYQDEWVLFEVTELDEFNEPVKGRLLCHSDSRDEVHEVAMRNAGAGVCLMTEFVGDPVPPGTYVVL